MASLKANMEIKESSDGVDWTLDDGCGTIVSIPITRWGHPNIRVNGERIPAAKLWTMFGKYKAAGMKVPRPLIIEEAKLAEVYRQTDGQTIVLTDSPQDKDIKLEDEIYARNERQRVRPLVKELDLRMAKIDGDVDARKLTHLLHFFRKEGWYPVAFADGRLMFSKDPENVFKLFGSRDWLRIMVYLRRPGSCSIPLDMSKL